MHGEGTRKSKEERAAEFLSAFASNDSATVRLRRHPFRVAVALALLALAAFVLFVLAVKPNQYTASALVKIEDTAPYIAKGSSSPAESANYVQTQIELMRSPMVVELLLARTEIANDPEIGKSGDRTKHLLSHVKVNRVGASELYEVTYTSHSPELAATVANAMVAEYLTIQSRGAYERYQRVVDLLEDERRRRQLDVDRQRRRVMELSKEVTGKDPFGLGIVLDAGVAEDAVVLRQQLREVQIARSVNAGEIDYLKKQQSTASTDAADGDDANAAAEPSASLADLQREHRALSAKLAYLTRELNSHVEKLEKGASKAVELTFAQAELAREERVFEAISQRKLDLQTESRAPARVTVQQKASVPLTPSQFLTRGTAGWAVVGLVALAVLALLSALRPSKATA